MSFNPLAYPISLATPERLADTAWSQHVPFGMAMVAMVKPRTLVELGTNKGVAYCGFCQAVSQLGLDTRCYAVSAWQGNSYALIDRPDVFADLKRYHDPRYAAFSTLIQSGADDADDAVNRVEGGAIDLLHIDGYHTHDAVRRAFDAWLPRMSERGVVLLHNTQAREQGFSVWRLWQELSAHYPHFEFPHGRGLGLLCVGARIPDGVRELVESSPDEQERVRRFYSLLGAAVAIQAQSHPAELERLARARDRELSRLQAQTDGLRLEAARARERLKEYQWLDSSRGVRVIRLARSTRSILRQQGVGYLAKRASLWLLGARNLGAPAVPAQQPPAVAAAPAAPSRQPTDALVRDQRLYTNSRFAGVSIVIPVFNALEYARLCVDSIYRVTTRIPFEVIIVDNGSQPDVLAWLRSEAARRENFWYISLSSNLGYARAMNIGVRYARGQYLMLSNSDVLATPHWLDKLVTVMEEHPDVGVLSPVTNYVGQGPQIDPVAAHLEPEEADEYAELIANRNEIQYVPGILVFFCVMARRNLLHLLGGIDESYGLGNFEDTDFCLRARVAGYTLGIARNTFVYHYGSKTFTANKVDHARLMQRNLIRFLDKSSELSTEITPTTPLRRISQIQVSVIVRTMNRPDTLRLALMSLANQTYRDFEVVVVNDGGPDIRPLLDTFAPYLDIQYLRHETARGRSAALNVGVQAARGAYLTYLDDDDIVYPTHLDTLVDAMAQASEDGKPLIYSDYNRTLMSVAHNTPVTVARVPVGTWVFNMDRLLVQNYMPIHTWLHDRALWSELGGFDHRLDMLEDWDFIVRAAQRRILTPTRRNTCEYRFYLTGKNSLLINREQAYQATSMIYARYPGNDAVESQRAITLNAIKAQSEAVSRRLKSLGPAEHLSENEVRELLAIVAATKWDA